MNSGIGLGRHRGVDLHDQRNALDPPDRRDVADKVEAELLIERDVDRVLRVHQQQRVAVGRHAGHGFGCDVAGGARPDLDEELLAEFFRQELGDQARDDVGRAARRLADDDFHRPRRIGLRPRDPRTRPAARQRPRPDAEIAAGKFQVRHVRALSDYARVMKVRARASD